LINTDAIIIGAGFGGMYMLHSLRKLGISVRAIEAGGDVGGVWYWNRYPGARCDNESVTYSYSFSDKLQQEWSWPDRYAEQPEILKYARHVADRFDLRRDIHFNTRVTYAKFDENKNRWLIKTDGESEFSARFCIMATGCLSVPKIPDIKGLKNFKGELYHTADWPDEGVDFSGKTVGIIGTGSSGIQSIPIIAKQAKHLTVFQRTPNFSIPAWNVPITPEKDQKQKKEYPALRRKARDSMAGDYGEENVIRVLDLTENERQAEFEKRWLQGGFNYQYAFADALESHDANELVAEFVHKKIHQMVNDSDVAELLCPKDYPFGTKRLCVDTGYYETFNRDNVSLVDIKGTPIKQMTHNGLQTINAEYTFDVLVLATGFDAMTGALTNIDIRGKENISLKQKWDDGARSYLGLAIAGFPNMFTINGPGSPSVLVNMILACEQHVEWITNCIAHLNERGADHIEAKVDAENAWTLHVNEQANRTLYPQANSWYLGANVPGKPRVFMPYVGGFKVYSDKCDKIAENGYEGFFLETNDQ